jgi:hypothetical protein
MPQLVRLETSNLARATHLFVEKLKIGSTLVLGVRGFIHIVLCVPISIIVVPLVVLIIVTIVCPLEMVVILESLLAIWENLAVRSVSHVRQDLLFTAAGRVLKRTVMPWSKVSQASEQRIFFFKKTQDHVRKCLATYISPEVIAANRLRRSPELGQR